MDLECGEVIEFVPEDPSDEWFVLGDGEGNRVGDEEFERYGEALKARQELLDSGVCSEVRVVRVSDAFQ